MLAYPCPERPGAENGGGARGRALSGLGGWAGNPSVGVETAMGPLKAFLLAVKN